MRYLVGVIALAPFVLLLLAMVTRRAQVRACCAPTSLETPSSEPAADSVVTATVPARPS